MKFAQIEKLRRRYLLAWAACVLAGILASCALAVLAGRLCRLRWDGGLGRALLNLVPLFIGGLVGYMLVHTVVWHLFFAPGYERLQEAFRRRALLSAYKECFSGVCFEPEEGLGQELVEKTNMLRPGNTYLSSDLLHAGYQGLPIDLAQVTIGYFQPGDRRRAARNEVWFSGVWIVYDISADKQVYVYLRSRKKGEPQEEERFYEEQPEARRVILKDESVNAQFDIFAAQPADAVRLLSPPFVRLLRRLRDEAGGQLLLCLCGGRLHIAVDGFLLPAEPSLLQPADPRDYRRQICGQLGIFTSFLDGVTAGKGGGQRRGGIKKTVRPAVGAGFQ